MIEGKIYKGEGIVIKRKNYGESDRILTIFTKQLGKIQVKAVGVRRITSRRSSHIELLNVSEFTLYRGRSLPILTEVQTREDFSAIKENLTKVGFAYHICELIDGLCAENQENRAVYPLLHNTLSRLANEEYIATIIHEFEVELLTILGFWSKARTIQQFNTHSLIENILERKLRSKRLFSHFS